MTGRTPASRFDSANALVSATPSAPFGPCGPPQHCLGALATKVGEIYGLAILGCLRTRPEAVPYAVGLVITAGYWFTSSTSFANPAATVARSFTDTFSGIAPGDAPGFILAQAAGALAATAVFGWLWSEGRGRSPRSAAPARDIAD